MFQIYSFNFQEKIMFNSIKLTLIGQLDYKMVCKY